MKKQTKEKISGILIVITAVLGCLIMAVVAGADGWLKKIVPETAKDKALEYMNTKYSSYGDTFTPVSWEGSSWAYNFDTICFKSQKYDNQVVTVHMYDDNDTYFTDDYYSLYMREDAERYFLEIAKEYGVDADVYITLRGNRGNEEIDENKTFKEYINSEGFSVDCDYLVTETVSEEVMEKVAKDIAKNNIVGLVNVKLLSSESDVQAYKADEDGLEFIESKEILSWDLGVDGTVNKWE